MNPEAELKEFLRKPKNDAEVEPPTLPPHLGNLPHSTYVTAALEYLDDYPFDRPFITPTGWAVDPHVASHLGWDEKAKSYLKACVKVDRTSLACIDPAYDPNRFIHDGIFKRRWALEELASEIIALLELIRRENRNSSTVATPNTTGKGIDDRVVDKVRLRDENCRLSGVTRSRKWTAEEAVKLRMSMLPAAYVEVAHALPLGMDDTSTKLLEVLTGLPITTWDIIADCVENALLMQSALRRLFGTFRIYLESDASSVIFIRARRLPDIADPTSELTSIVNDELRPCNLPSALVDNPLRSPKLHTIPDIDMKFFALHKFIGDIAWMCGGAEVEFEDEDEDVSVLSAENWTVFQEKLTYLEHFDGTNANGHIPWDSSCEYTETEKTWT